MILNNILLASSCVLAGAATFAPGADAQDFQVEQVKLGAETYARHCSPCHGPRMQSPDAFDLKTFPKDGEARFLTSVTKGKNAMPPWEGLLKPEEIRALWAYVSTGEK